MDKGHSYLYDTRLTYLWQYEGHTLERSRPQVDRLGSIAKQCESNCGEMTCELELVDLS